MIRELARILARVTQSAGLATAIGGMAMAADLYVAPAGRDTWSGTLPEANAAGTDGPFATLERARDAVRTRPEGNVTVQIRGGRYMLRDTVVFSSPDSAGPDRTITYEAFDGETPVFTSAVPVRNWRRLREGAEDVSTAAAGKLWVADVSEHTAFRQQPGDRGRRFYSLYEGDSRLPRARSAPFARVNTGAGDHRLVRFAPGTLPRYRRLADAELRIIPMRFWIMNLLPIESLDPETGDLVTARPGTYSLSRNGMNDRNTAWIENVLEELDQPGEWVLDSDAGIVYLWPRGDSPQDMSVPCLTELIRVEGAIDRDGPKDTPVEGLVFRGLTFCQGGVHPWEGLTGWGLQHDWEMFDAPTALVRLRGAERCSIENCEFRDSSHSALRLDLHCRRNRVVGNRIHHIGGVGILLAGYGPGTKDVNRDNEVTNNYIHHIGREFWASVAIWAWQSGHNRIAHNHIHSIPYTGILVTGRISRSRNGKGECSRTIRWDEVPESFAKGSWRAREPYLHARHNIVEYNDIHDAMETLGDGNCIYVSGCGTGNIVRGNYCHDCYGKYMNAVIRCDDDQHGTLMTHNVCRRTEGHAEGFISKGDNAIINNVIVDLRATHRHRGYIVFPYGSIKGARIERNILVSRRPRQVPYYCGKAPRHGDVPLLTETTMGHNLYWSQDDPVWAGKHLLWAAKQGLEQGSAAADPRFTDVDAGDFSFRPGSPAPGLGIEPVDVSKAGLEPSYHERFLGETISTTIRPDGGVLKTPVRIHLSSSRPAAVIRYTTDGRAPTAESPRYTGPFQLAEPALVRARSFHAIGLDVRGAAARFYGPPAPLDEDFEAADVGAPAPGAETHEDPAQGTYTARVTNALAAAGDRSLCFRDGPGQTFPFNPHVVYRFEFHEGVMVGAFDIRADAETSFRYQWRHYDDGYVHGPRLTVEPGGVLSVGERGTVGRIPVGQWVHIEVRCRLGGRETTTFDLVAAPRGDAPAIVVEGIPCDPGFSRLDWVGFIAHGQRKCEFHVDNVVVRQE